MRTYYSIGLLYKIFGDDTQCEGYLKQVYRQCIRYLDEDDRKTQKIKSMLIGMNVNVDDINMDEGDQSEDREGQESQENEGIDGFWFWSTLFKIKSNNSTLY